MSDKYQTKDNREIKVRGVRGPLWGMPLPWSVGLPVRGMLREPQQQAATRHGSVPLQLLTRVGRTAEALPSASKAWTAARHIKKAYVLACLATAFLRPVTCSFVCRDGVRSLHPPPCSVRAYRCTLSLSLSLSGTAEPADIPSGANHPAV